MRHQITVIKDKKKPPLSRVIGSELVQKYVGEGARMVRELFEMARTKKACLIFFDEIDAVGGARYIILCVSWAKVKD